MPTISWYDIVMEEEERQIYVERCHISEQQWFLDSIPLPEGSPPEIPASLEAEIPSCEDESDDDYKSEILIELIKIVKKINKRLRKKPHYYAVLYDDYEETVLKILIKILKHARKHLKKGQRK